MTEERFQEFLRGAAQDYHRPPETPREEMWQAIQAERRERVEELERQAWRWPHRVARSPWVRWGVGIAAALVVGVAIGRFSERGQPVETAAAPSGRAAVEAGAARGAELAAPYRWVATEHLGRVETFLTGFRVDARQGQPVSDPTGSARQLLSSTRLLLDSPASDDPRLRNLLEDIELVLAQIAQFRGESDGEELDLIDDSIEQRSVLLRLQSVVSAQAARAGSQGVL
jgi:hypothetical protein